MASADTPSFPLIPNYRLESHLSEFCRIGVAITVLKCFRIRKRVQKKGSFGKGAFSEKIHFQEILENLEILENTQIVENKGESDHFLEILENLEILEILEIP